MDHKLDHKFGRFGLWSTLWSKVIDSSSMRYDEADHMDHKYEPYKRRTAERVERDRLRTSVSGPQCHPKTNALTSSMHSSPPQLTGLYVCNEVVQVVHHAITPSGIISCHGPHRDFMWSEWTTFVVHVASLMFLDPNGWIGLRR